MDLLTSGYIPAPGSAFNLLNLLVNSTVKKEILGFYFALYYKIILIALSILF